MKRLIILFALALPCMGQSIFSTSGPSSGTPVIAVVGSTPTCSFIVNGLNDKTATFTTTNGTFYGLNPGTNNGVQTIGLKDTTARTDTVTATANGNHSLTATCSIQFVAAPTAVTTWPRDIITQANIAGLIAKFNTGSPMATDIKQAGIDAFNADSSTSRWGITGSTGFSCLGGNGQPSTNLVGSVGLEDNIIWYALLALLDPSDGTYNWSCYAHDVAAYVFVQYPLQQPDPHNFPMGANNGWSDPSWEWAFMGGWLRGSGAISTSGDLTAMRNFYGYLSAAGYVGAGTNPNPASAYNSSAMFAPGTPNDLNNMRGMSGNNYYMSRYLLMVASGLLFNDGADSPNYPTGQFNTCGATRYVMCSDGTAGSIIAYWKYATGAIQYNLWAHFEDPDVSWQAYQTAYSNLPTRPQCEGGDTLLHNCFGDGRDGGSAEGEYYGYSLFRLRYALDLMHGAGMDDPAVIGPQASLSNSSWWDLKWVHDLEVLGTPMPYGQSGYPGDVMEPALDFLEVGDTQNYERQMLDANTETAILVGDWQTGRTDRANNLEWYSFNISRGGPLGTSYNCADHCGVLNNMSNGDGGQAKLDFFFALPAANPVGGTLPTDPRSSLPTDLADSSFNQQQVMRTNWGSSNSSKVSWWNNNSENNHEYDWDGRFDVKSCLSGVCDRITSGAVIFNGNYSYYKNAANLAQNELGLTNAIGIAVEPNYQWHEMYLNGGQFPQGAAATLSTQTHSELPAYSAAIDNTGNAYNGIVSNGHFNQFTDILSASSSKVWLRGTNQIAWYDRAAVAQVADFQVDNLISTGPATIASNTASWPTRSTTQKAYLTNLLPAGTTISNGVIATTLTTTGPHSSIQTGTTMQLTTTGQNVGGATVTGIESSPYTTWVTQDPTIATVNSTGLVTAVGVGSTQVLLIYLGEEAFVPFSVISGSSSGSLSSTTIDTAQPQDWEPYGMLTETPPGTPTASQFLNVLEWGASGGSKTSTTLVQSISGQAFDGAFIGSNLVMFMRAWPTTFTSVTYPASGATTHYISDLTPNTLYAISGAGAPSSATTDTAGVLAFSAAGTGNIQVGTPAVVGGSAVGGSSVFAGSSVH